MAPDVAFRKMNIHRFYLGFTADQTSGGTVHRAGSLELMGDHALDSVAGWPRAVRSRQVDTGEDAELDATPRDLVIMNPPFTRADLRHDQLGITLEKNVKAREQALFAGTPAHRSHYGGMFLILSERLCVKDTGSLALIYPTASCGAPSASGVWKHLLDRFHLETVVTSHDPTRIFFSENTNINESLFILRRLNRAKQNISTRFIQLAHNPTTAADAVLLADRLRKDSLPEKQGQILYWSRDRIMANDWTPIRFLSPFLSETVYGWFGERSLGLVPLRQIAEVGPGGGALRASSNPHLFADESGRPGMWYNNQEDVAPNGAPPKQTLRVRPDCYLHPKPGKKDLDRLWYKSSRLLLPDRFSTTSIRLFGIVTDEATFGSAWTAVNARNSQPGWEEAMAVYLNSTVGILATLYRVNPKKLVYPNMSLDGMRNIPVPKLDDHQIAALADHYHRIANIPLLRLRDQANDTVRASLDEVVCLTMGWDQEAVRKARFVLSEEPSITGRPAGDPGSRQSRPGKGRRSRSRPHPALFQD